jgi:hypothetical protein
MVETTYEIIGYGVRWKVRMARSGEFETFCWFVAIGM